jgi:hypothetical protein
MMFDPLCTPDQQSRVLSVLSVTSTTIEEKYLGLPTPEGRMGKGKFKSTKESLVKRFSNWAERHMSSGVKELLIKSVAQAIPTYVMDIFKLPTGLCEEMTQLIRKFWWGEEGNQRKVHWLAWEKLIVPKCRGGNGVS